MKNKSFLIILISNLVINALYLFAFFYFVMLEASDDSIVSVIGLYLLIQIINSATFLLSRHKRLAVYNIFKISFKTFSITNILLSIIFLFILSINSGGEPENMLGIIIFGPFLILYLLINIYFAIAHKKLNYEV